MNDLNVNAASILCALQIASWELFCMQGVAGADREYTAEVG